MLSIKQINEFMEYMSSGEFEREFSKCGEIGKGEMLELLERLMDAGELADLTATRIIYRNLPVKIKENDK